jgi:hypothetical protein
MPLTYFEDGHDETINFSFKKGHLSHHFFPPQSEHNSKSPRSVDGKLEMLEEKFGVDFALN